MAAADQSPAESMPEPALLALAREKFGALSRAEEELFRAAQEGRIASALTGHAKQDRPDNAPNWNADRVVRAICISWVCTDPQASALVTHRGVQFYGMRIDGELDLSNAEIKFSFAAWKCAFSEDISLRDAQLRGFNLAACQIISLDANRTSINGAVFLRNGFTAKGVLNLMGARISGNLDCSGAQLSNLGGLSLTASGAQIEGHVFLRAGFRATGAVNLMPIEIGGDLDCSGAHLSNAGGFALLAANAKIEGNVLLRKGFEAEGQVNLMATTIGGNLDCDGAQISTANGWAVDAEKMKIEGGVFLRQSFEARGGVSLIAAKVGGNLECDGAKFTNVSGSALNAERSKIEGDVFLRNDFQAYGRVSLLGATIGGLQIHRVKEAQWIVFDLRLAKVETFCDDEGSWPWSNNLFLDGFRYERFYEEAPLEADKRKKWLSLQPRDRFRPQPYEQLAAVLRQMGHETEARQVMIAKNHERASHTRFGQQGWWWYNFFGRLIGYGYAPWRAFAMSLAMICLGYFLFYLGSTHSLISPTSDKAYAKAPNGQVIIENGGQKVSEDYPVFHALVYSVESFTPLLKLDQTSNWTPNANRSAEISMFHLRVPYSGRFLRGYLYFHIASGWLLTSLWVGAITGLVKT